MLYVFSGQARTGKDTAAKILHKMIGEDCQSIAYADYLKEILMNCFGLTYAQLYGDDKEECVDSLPIRTKSGIVTTHFWTTRKLLQYVGTIFRVINPNCWVNVVKKKVLEENLYSNYVITDARYDNEIDWIIENGGAHIHIEREDKAFASNRDHISETSLPDFNVENKFNSYVISNNEDLNILKYKLKNILNILEEKKWQLKNTH